MKLPCPACNPRPGKAGKADCEKCEGKGKVHVPFRYAEVYTPDMQEFLRSHAFYREQGVLPEPGGLNDQPATWIDAAELFRSCLNWIEQEREAHGSRKTREEE